jgi:hypothetical protein
MAQRFGKEKTATRVRNPASGTYGARQTPEMFVDFPIWNALKGAKA